MEEGVKDATKKTIGREITFYVFSTVANTRSVTSAQLAASGLFFVCVACLRCI